MDDKELVDMLVMGDIMGDWIDGLNKAIGAAANVAREEGRSDHEIATAIRLLYGKDIMLLDVHECEAGTSYTVMFRSEDEAVAYIERHSSTCAFDALGDLSQYPKLHAAIYPTCEHGLSLSLCGGPNHYYD